MKFKKGDKVKYLGDWIGGNQTPLIVEEIHEKTIYARANKNTRVMDYFDKFEPWHTLIVNTENTHLWDSVAE